MKKQLIAVVLALSFMASGAARAEGTNAFSFVALGDLPYGAAEKAYAPYRALIERINQSHTCRRYQIRFDGMQRPGICQPACAFPALSRSSGLHPRR